MGVADCLPRTIWWEDAGERASDGGGFRVVLIDQRRLPSRLETMRCSTYAEMIEAIRSLALRGAPAIGAGGAFALALWAVNETDGEAGSNLDSLMATMEGVAAEISAARPTAVNLSWGVDQVARAAREAAAEHAGDADAADAVRKAMIFAARALAEADEASNRAIGRYGAQLVRELGGGAPMGIMTHCNAGSLATVFYGTALGAIYSSFDEGLVEMVYPCETRPVNQGGRLSAWELRRAGVPTTLICDDMAASTMSAGLVDMVIVGADRIAANGDAANKIGTLGHAILAAHFDIPFVVAAPFSTIDRSIPDGSAIEIEQRDPDEVRGFFGNGFILPENRIGIEIRDAVEAVGLSVEVPMGGQHRMMLRATDEGVEFDMWMRTTPEGIGVINPAFDVTPAELITAIVTDKGVLRPGSDGTYAL